MAEKMSEVFEMYDVRLDHIGRGRGAMLLQTDKGVRQIRATTAGEKRLQAEYDFKEHMYLAGFPHIDRLVKNVEAESSGFASSSSRGNHSAHLESYSSICPNL